MRYGALLCLLSIAAVAQDRGTARTRVPRSLGVGEPSLAAFEFAPASGAGMTTPCTCTAPTGARGETLTYSRTGVASCMRGNWFSGIANGDLVKCAANQPRVMYGQFADGGFDNVLGLLVEPMRTNYLTYTDDLSGSGWATQASGCAAPTVTRDAGVAPDNTSTAVRLDFPMCNAPGANYSAYYHTVAVGTGAAQVSSIWVRGVDPGDGGVVTGQLPVHHTPNGSTYYAGTYCNFTSASWTQCVSATYTPGATIYYVLGPDFRDSSFQLDGGAFSVLVYGPQLEMGTSVSSYIPSGAAATARGADVAYAPLPGSSSVGSGSVAVTWVSPVTAGTFPIPFVVASTVPPGSTNQLLGYSPGTSGTTTQCYLANAAGGAFTTGLGSPAGGSASGAHRQWCSVDNRVHGGVDATTFSDSATISGTFGAASYLIIGGAGSAADVNSSMRGVVSRVCWDPNPARCR